MIQVGVRLFTSASGLNAVDTIQKTGKITISGDREPEHVPAGADKATAATAPDGCRPLLRDARGNGRRLVRGRGHGVSSIRTMRAT